MSSFTEPTSLRALRWGTYRERHLAGLILITAGAIGMQGTSTYAVFPLALGALAHAIGWWIMPAGGWRRIWVVLPSTIGCVALLAGPVYAAAAAVPLLAWLIVRHRPVLTFLVAVPVVLVGLQVPTVTTDYDSIMPVIALMAALVVGAAWLARLAAASRLFHRNPRQPTP